MAETIDDLSTRAINAKDAVVCCESGYIRAVLEVNEFIASLIREVLEDPKPGHSIALVGIASLPGGATAYAPIGEVVKGVVARPRIIQIGPGVSLGLGAVVLLSAIQLADVARQTGFLEALSAIGAAASHLGSNRKNRGGCEECVRRKMFEQGKARKWTEQRSYRRV